ncbi:MAG TPA: hypothetical protein VN914_06310, partial [Polyangia bacterium]|nr:hypothetical protein [Polyangia bacterium]
RGNCFHCHGPTANYRKYQNKRWDVYDRNAEPYVRLGFGPVTEQLVDSQGKPFEVVTVTGAKDNGLLLPPYVESGGADRMPPPPATPLSARDVQVLKNWARSKTFALGSHHPNHKAAIGWLDEGARRVALTDEDGDTVVGKLDCGGTPVSFDHGGGFTLPDGATPPCTGTLYDGFEETDVDLK